MLQRYDIRKVEAIEREAPETARELAETIAIGAWDEPDPEVQADIEDKIDDLARQELDALNLDYDEFKKYDASGQRDMFKLENGLIGVYWTAASIVEVGTAEEFAKDFVQSFQRHKSEPERLSM
jgi:hypothetical protein